MSKPRPDPHRSLSEAMAELLRDQEHLHHDGGRDHGLQQHLHGDGTTPAPAVRREAGTHGERAKGGGRD